MALELLIFVVSIPSPSALWTDKRQGKEVYEYHLAELRKNKAGFLSRNIVIPAQASGSKYGKSGEAVAFWGSRFVADCITASSQIKGKTLRIWARSSFFPLEVSRYPRSLSL